MTVSSDPDPRGVLTGKAEAQSASLTELPRQLAALRMIADTVNTDLESDETQIWMVEGISKILRAESCILILLEGESENNVIRKTLNSLSEWVTQTNLSFDRGLVANCIRLCKPVRVNDVGSESEYDPFSDNMNGLEVKSLLCVPLAARDKTLGAIEVLNKQDGEFDSYDLELLMAMATSIANAIHNIRLIRQLKEANTDLETSRWELLRSRNTLRALFDSTPTSIYIVDNDHNLIAINRTRSRLAGRQPNELVGRLCYEALFNRSEPCAGCRVRETLTSGPTTHRIERRSEVDGNTIELEIDSYPIFNESGQVMQAFLFEEDVTEERRLEATLAQSEKLAAVGQLAAGVAHEINNPLTAIIANAQLLQRRLPRNDEEALEMIDLIARAGNRATQVVRNLLDFARKERYEFASTDINETIRHTLALIQHEVITRGITVAFDPAPDLPEIQASSDHLQGVWLNLLLNAMDAIDTDHGKIRITTRKHHHEIQITVIDNGRGIPTERVSRIFEPFYTTKEPGRGTGLGLSVCHRIVKQHGGHILVDSQVGIGTDITVILPLP